MAHYEVKKLILSGLARISAQNFERLIFKTHLAFKNGHTVRLPHARPIPICYSTIGSTNSAVTK